MNLLSFPLIHVPHRQKNRQKNKQTVEGKIKCQFCYLSTPTLFLERKRAKIPCERKTWKWATKLRMKRMAKGKGREREKRSK